MSESSARPAATSILGIFIAVGCRAALPSAAMNIPAAEFLFTGINKIKPDMIEEATVNARKAAEKFAADSNSKVGAIRRATQGTFEINDSDSSSPHRKIVRVVTTVDYFLK